MTIDELRAQNPFPWRQEINFDGKGGVRLLDAANQEVPMFNITGLAIFATKNLVGTQGIPA